MPALGVAAVGNVYTRRDRRGRGLAARVTSAVTAHLLRHDPPLSTVALNVNQHNAAALRVYAGLGYERYCGFHEGLARRIDDPLRATALRDRRLMRREFSELVNH